MITIKGTSEEVPIDSRFILPSSYKMLRKSQLQAAEIAADLIANGTEVVVIDASVGFGKGLCAELVRQILATRMLYVAPKNELINQMQRSLPFAETLKGRSNYPHGGPNGFRDFKRGISCAECQRQALCKEKRYCAYHRDKDKFIKGSVSITNTAYYLVAANYLKMFNPNNPSKDFKGWQGGNYLTVFDECLIGESLVYTSKGERRIDECVPGTIVYGWDDSSFVEKPVTNLKCNGFKETKIITLSNGRTITGTDNHPILTTRGWVKIGNLKTGDTCIGRKNLHNLPEEIRVNGNDKKRSQGEVPFMSLSMDFRENDLCLWEAKNKRHSREVQSLLPGESKSGVKTLPRLRPANEAPWNPGSLPSLLLEVHADRRVSSKKSYRICKKTERESYGTGIQGRKRRGRDSTGNGDGLRASVSMWPIYSRFVYRQSEVGHRSDRKFLRLPTKDLGDFKEEGRVPKKSRCSNASSVYREQAPSFVEGQHNRCDYIKVVSIQSGGLHKVYDISVKDVRNFLVEGVVAHNCDTLADSMLGFWETTITQSFLKEVVMNAVMTTTINGVVKPYPIPVPPVNDFSAWMGYWIDVRELIETAIKRHGTPDPQDVLAVAWMNRLIKMKLALDMVECDWIYDPERAKNAKGIRNGPAEKVTLKPMVVGEMGKGILWDHCGRTLCMSGSIISLKVFAEETGLDKSGKSYEMISYETNWDKWRRTIFRVGGVEVVKKVRTLPWSQQPFWDEYIGNIAWILSRHPNDRHLIHAVSHDLAKEIGKSLGEIFGNRILVSQSFTREQKKRGTCNGVVSLESEETADRDEALARYLEEPGKVLISASFSRGTDLPYAKCRGLIIAKCPWKSIGDRRIKAILEQTESGKMWYLVQCVRDILQSLGRGVRSSDDWCRLWVVDDQFDRIVQYRGLLPDYIKETIREKDDYMHRGPEIPEDYHTLPEETMDLSTLLNRY